MAHLLKPILRLLPKQVKRRIRTYPPVYRMRNVVCGWKYGNASHDQIYDKSYFQGVEQSIQESVDAIADSIVSSFAPKTVIDVGCGTGALLDSLRTGGVTPYGIEYADQALAFCRRRQLPVRQLDLTNKSQTDEITGHFDVAISMEVGQQLPTDVADQYVDLLCRLSDVVVFSSDVPGGFDRRPINEQRREYWIDKFVERHFEFDAATTKKWQSVWKEKGTTPFFHENLSVFRFQSETAARTDHHDPSHRANAPRSRDRAFTDGNSVPARDPSESDHAAAD